MAMIQLTIVTDLASSIRYTLCHAESIPPVSDNASEGVQIGLQSMKLDLPF